MIRGGRARSGRKIGVFANGAVRNERVDVVPEVLHLASPLGACIILEHLDRIEHGLQQVCAAPLAVAEDRGGGAGGGAGGNLLEGSLQTRSQGRRIYGRIHGGAAVYRG